MKSIKPRSFLVSLVLLGTLAASAVFSKPALASVPGQSTSPDRPLVVIESYSTDKDTITPGQDFTLHVSLRNVSTNKDAHNIILTFASGDLIPRETGGTKTITTGLGPGQAGNISQPMIASPAANGGTVGNITATVTYYDSEGTAYTGAFNIALHITWPAARPASPTATPTAISVERPQVTITGYDMDVDPLQPGLPFNLDLEVRNLGNGDAKGVTMIMGGGSGSAGGAGGTPEPGGVSGGSGDFGNFAPLKSSNIHFIGDIGIGQTTKITQPLIVNVSTNPGAYSVKFSFAYVDGRGTRFVDDQVITLLVYQIPLVDITFYREPGPFFAGQPGALPIQITNLSRKATILGNMKASVKTGGQVQNDVTLVGAMDPGGYFTLDATLIPEQTGPMDLDITINYTDDFNQPKTIHHTLQVEVQEQMMEPGMEGGVPGGKPGEVIVPGEPAQAPETFWQKVIRFAKGMIGLDSSVPQQVSGPLGPGGGSNTSEPAFPEGKPMPMPVPMKGG